MNCKAIIFSGYRNRRCGRTAQTEGYCNSHHPAAVAKRQDERQAKWDTKMADISHQTTTRHLQAAVIVAAKAWVADSNSLNAQALRLITKRLLVHEVKK